MENPDKKLFKICITGAGGFIGYSLISHIISGGLFQEYSDIELRLLELPSQLKNLEGIREEIKDCGATRI